MRLSIAGFYEGSDPLFAWKSCARQPVVLLLDRLFQCLCVLGDRIQLFQKAFLMHCSAHSSKTYRMSCGQNRTMLIDQIFQRLDRNGHFCWTIKKRGTGIRERFGQHCLSPCYEQIQPLSVSSADSSNGQTKLILQLAQIQFQPVFSGFVQHIDTQQRSRTGLCDLECEVQITFQPHRIAHHDGSIRVFKCKVIAGDNLLRRPVKQ